MSIRVLVADDQALVREGLMTLLAAAPEIEPVGAARDGAEAVAMSARHRPDVVLMDLRMPGGALGYLTKDAGIAEISRAVQAAAAGQSLVDAAVQSRLLAAASARARPAPSPAAPPDELTPREAEVLGLIARGLSNSEIAAHLVVSEATVKTHINHLFAKTGARDRAQAVHYAYTHGLAG